MRVPATPGYCRPKLLADTLEELEIRCGAHGKAAVEAVRWGAVVYWMMNLPIDAHELGHLTNPQRIAALAVSLISADDYAQLGYPQSSRLPRVSPLVALSREAADEARLTAAETRADWERAGSPHINRQRIETVHMYLQACEVQSANLSDDLAASLDKSEQQ